MLDIKAMRKDPERFKIGLTNRGFDAIVIDQVLVLDKKLRNLKAQVEELRRQKKILTKEFYKKHIEK